MLEHLNLWVFHTKSKYKKIIAIVFSRLGHPKENQRKNAKKQSITTPLNALSTSTNGSFEDYANAVRDKKGFQQKSALIKNMILLNKDAPTGKLF